jgi:hypothetical protein
MKKIILSTFIAAAAFAVGTVNAQIIAQDLASNYTTATWTNGANLGTGFSSSWAINTGTGVAGAYIGSAAAQGVNNAPLNTSGASFGLYADSFANAGRSFTALNPGDVFSIGLAYQFDNGNRGINLLSGTTEIFNFNINSSGYQWSGGGSAASTAWPGLRENGVYITLSFTGTPTGFAYSFSSPQATSINGLGGSVTTNAITGFQAYVSGAGGGTGGDFFVNSPTVVPEPSTYALLALSAAGLAGYTARRRARK